MSIRGASAGGRTKSGGVGESSISGASPTDHRRRGRPVRSHPPAASEPELAMPQGK